MSDANPSCLFCRIGAGEAPGAFVYEDADVLAFLDIRPLFPGHVLVIPRAHCRTLMDLPPVELPHLMAIVQKLSVAVKAAMNSDGIFIASNNGVSQSVDHLHIHVVPRRKKDGLRGFMWPRLSYADEDEMAATARKIAGAL